MVRMCNQDKLPYLPDEILEHILSYVEDVDTRRYFGVYTKLNKERYDAVRTAIPLTRYYQWQCLKTCPLDCEKHEYPFEFNPILTPVLSQGNYGVNFESVFNAPTHGFSPIGNYTKYSISYGLPNLVEGNRVPSILFEHSNVSHRYSLHDMMHVDILVFENSVIYHVGIWRIKRKTGENAKETKCMYYLGEFDQEHFFTDYLLYSYELH